jgi:hypothetical protein
MCINKLPILSVVSLILMMQLSCNSYSEIHRQKPSSKDEVLAYMKAGFVYANPRLFSDQLQNDKFSRMEILLKYLGYGDFKWETFKVSSDGRCIRFISHENPKKYLILGKETKVYDFFEDSNNVPIALDNNNKPVVWAETGGKNSGEFVFSGVGKIILPTQDPRFDNAGEYFCCGGRYYDNDTGQTKKIPLYIYSVSNPTKPLVQSILPYVPEKIITTANKIYLIERTDGYEPRGISCEEYKKENGSLLFCRSFKVDCPLKLGVRWLTFLDLDEKTHVMLVYDSEYYLLNMDTLKLDKLPDIQNYSHWERMLFLDPNIFKDIINASKSK